MALRLREYLETFAITVILKAIFAVLQDLQRMVMDKWLMFLFNT